jgi:SSS family solute:Na+ symporter
MTIWDWVVVAIYFAMTLLVGFLQGRRQQDVETFFLAKRNLPVLLALFSVIATETSAVSFLSVPAEVLYGDLTFLQLPMGFVVGRTLVAFFLLPGFFEPVRLSLYESLQRAFGPAVQHGASLTFMGMRTVADGMRLYLTALVVATTTGWDLTTGIVVTAGVAMLYALVGGFRAVVWTDAFQLAVYLGGAAIGLGCLVNGSLSEAVSAWEQASNAGKLRLFNLSLDLANPNTFWAGLLGGTVLSAATHGADQMMVQRYLATGSLGRARLVLIGSGIAVFVQFVLFGLLGTALWAEAPLESRSTSQVPEGVVLEGFLVALPSGARGMVVAAVLAAAMSTLSSSLNSVASAAVGDLLRWKRQDLGRGELFVARCMSFAAGLAQVAAALVAAQLLKETPVIRGVLAVASLAAGVLLGLLVLAQLCPGPSPIGLTALGAGLTISSLAFAFLPVAYPWLGVVSAVSTMASGAATAWIRSVVASRSQP